MAKIIGIDLGTTNSLAAVWECGRSRLIPNGFGEYLTPSVVSVGDEGEIYVGRTAKERLASSPARTAAGFKRFMGTPKIYRLGSKNFRPEELSALVLRKLKEDVEKYLGETVEEAVVSVPAYFDDMARSATRRAGELAGFRVERLINEPSAAALACHYENREEDASILVYDFGGGTLDVSLVECFDNVVEIRAVSGDNHLGGRDFDNVMAEYFIKQCGLSCEEDTPQTRALIREAAERCKRELSEWKEAQMTFRFEGMQKQLVITRRDLVRIAAELFERMSRPIGRVLQDGGISAAELDKIVLVGGSCKMPLTRQYLEHILGRKDLTTADPDHMIALGVGIYAGVKERDEEVKDMLLTDICPFSLGIGTYNRMNPDRNLMSFIIERNSPLPISREEHYYTVRDGQDMLEAEIFQGEEMYVEDNIYLGKLEVKIPPRPKGEVHMNVRFTYDLNGVLEVNVHVPATGEKKQLVIVNKELGLTQKEVAGKLKEMQKLKINAFEEEENQYVLAWARRLFIQCSGSMKSEVERRTQYFVHVMDADFYQIPRVRKYLMVFLAAVEQMNDRLGFDGEEAIRNGSWYEDDEDGKEVEASFREWDEEQDRGDDYDI